MARKTKGSRFIFRSEHFYKLLESQGYKCALTGRELTPENTIAEHIVPLRQGGQHEFENIYLVEKVVSKLKRFTTEQEIVRLAVEIIGLRGKEFGYAIRQVGRK